MQACVQVSDEICTVPLEIILYLQSNWNSVTESLASSMGVCLLKSCCCMGAGLSLKLTNLWASEPVAVACGHVHRVLEVHSMKYFAQEMFVHVLDLPALLSLLSLVLYYWRVFLKVDANSGFLHWLSIACCCFHMSPNIWNIFDVPLGTLILSPLILPK